MSELKPCPFCGLNNNSHTNHCYFTVASKASTYERQYPYVKFKKPSKEDIVNAWDNRPHENKIKTDVIGKFVDYVQDKADAWWLEDIADNFIKELEENKL